MHFQAPTALIILDGWGHRKETKDNAIAQAKAPTWKNLIEKHPNTLISGSGDDVGLPAGQMGNSEVGHMNIGAGRVLYQDLTRINLAVEDGTFRQNPVLSQALESVKNNQRSLHIMGLLSPGGVHSQETHIAQLCQWAIDEGLSRIYLHAFLDGRDTPPQSAQASLELINSVFKDSSEHRIASLIGRFYAMDRDKRWDRVQKAYNLLAYGQSEFTALNALEGLEAAYKRGETDEFVSATRIGEAAPIQSGDTLVFMNFRADRARELTQAFTEPKFDGFERPDKPELTQFISLTEYEAQSKAVAAYPPETITHTIGEVVSELGLKQLRIAETEKYAHVTFFMNGGVEAVFPGEERILIPSPSDIRTYDEKPEMSAFELTEKLVEAIRSKQFDLIICNYANTDMVGHTGNFEAAVKAVEAVDSCLKQVTDALASVGGQCLITADHGNAEMMVNPTTQQPHTAHTCELVPLVYFGPQKISLSSGGVLADVAPTLLSLCGIDQPREMSGRDLSQTVE